MIQNSATFIKLGALVLVAWACLSSLSVSWATFILVEGFVVLLAFLDAGQAVPAGAGRDQAADVGALGKRLLGVAVGPFYLVLAALAGVGMWDKMQATGSGGATVVAAAPGHAGGCGSGGGCGTSGGCGSGSCGASSGGSCGCSSKKGGAKAVAAPGSNAVKPPPPRSMATATPTKLPGLGPNGRPLPAGLVPRPGVVLPPGVQPTPTVQRGVSPSAGGAATSATTEAVLPAPAVPTPLSPGSVPAPAPVPVPQPAARAVAPGAAVVPAVEVGVEKSPGA